MIPETIEVGVLNKFWPKAYWTPEPMFYYVMDLVPVNPGAHSMGTMRRIVSADHSTEVIYQMRDSDRPMCVTREEILQWIKDIAAEPKPQDHCLVFADWLGERGDLRAEQVRRLGTMPLMADQEIAEFVRLMFFIDCRCSKCLAPGCRSRRGHANGLCDFHHAQNPNVPRRPVCRECDDTGWRLAPDDLLIEFTVKINGKVVTLKPKDMLPDPLRGDEGGHDGGPTGNSG